MNDRMAPTEDFYSSIPLRRTFENLADSGAYKPLPEDWFVGVADIVGSTEHIAQGRYKLVNTVGAAAISAQINSCEGRLFPFAFGGDGSFFAFPNAHQPKARAALAAVKRWALDEFDIELRAATVSVPEIHAAGYDVRVARFQPAPGVDYAMFTGGGMSWAEQQMKAGKFAEPIAPVGTLPDLTGLSCRWIPMKSRHGVILSIVVLPGAETKPQKLAEVMHKIVELTDSLERSGHPVPEEGPGYAWPPDGLKLEAHATRGNGSLFRRHLRLLWDTAVAWVFFKTKLKAGGFDPTHYVRTVGSNADFRKFEDGLMMTLDCDRETRNRLEALLEKACYDGVIRYGISEQDSAIMTCIVPSVTSDDHIHFIDGAAGGYATAASQIKHSM